MADRQNPLLPNCTFCHLSIKLADTQYRSVSLCCVFERREDIREGGSFEVTELFWQAQVSLLAVQLHELHSSEPSRCVWLEVVPCCEDGVRTHSRSPGSWKALKGRCLCTVFHSSDVVLSFSRVPTKNCQLHTALRNPISCSQLAH